MGKPAPVDLAPLREEAGEPETPEIVPAYVSYTAMPTDFEPVAVGGDPDTKPDERHAGVIGWEFFLPHDPALDDDSLPAEAVKMVRTKTSANARAAFHKSRRGCPRARAPSRSGPSSTALSRYRSRPRRRR